MTNLKHDYLKNLESHLSNGNSANYCLSSNIDERYMDLFPNLSRRQLFELAAYYPDAGLRGLKDKIQKKFGVNTVVLGAGSEDLLIRLNRLAVAKGKGVGVVLPVFYRILDTLEPIRYKGMSYSTFAEKRLDLDVVWLNNPNPVSGEIKTNVELLKVFKQNSSTIFIVDEALMFLVDEWGKYSLLRYTRDYSNFIVLSSFSKLYGVSGLRAGFASGNKKLLEEIEALGLTFPLTSVTTHVLSKLIEEDNFLDKVRKQIIKNKSEVGMILKDVPRTEVKSSKINCVYCRFNNGRKIYQSLLSLGVISLDLDTQEGMAKEGYVRLTIHSSPKLHDYLVRRLRQLYIA